MIDNNTKKIVDLFGLHEGMKVADLGVGFGHYVYALSEAVGPSGRVFAVDVQKNMIERLKKEVEEKGIQNIEVIWGDIEVVGGTKLREGLVDNLLVANVLFLIDSKPGFVHECARILKVGGKLLLIDWEESFGGIGPSPEMVVSLETAKRIFESGPFEYKKQIDVGDHHYGILFERKKS